MSQFPALAYKVLTSDQMAALLADGTFSGSPVDLADGFIHMSTAEQLAETVARHFAGQQGLHVVAVDLAMLGHAVRWERSRGGALFPHVYGAINIEAVVKVVAFPPNADGTFTLPVI